MDKDKKLSQINIRISDKLYKELEKEAHADDRAVSYLVRKILETWLEEREQSK